MLKRTLMTTAFAAVLGVAGPAWAGNIFLTGHDADLHMFVGSASGRAALTSELTFVRNGSTLPVLTLDGGSNELSADLTTLGIAHVNIDPTTSALTAAVFDPKLYSAIAVASMVDCGGCDNTAAGLANIATFSSAIAAFFNAGGGILGLSGADDLTAYAYVPQAAFNAGGNPPDSGFVETAAGTAVGLLAENGDPTHNFFGTPGVGGLSSAYQVAEVNSGNNESLFVQGGSIICVGASCGIVPTVPEPSTYALLGLGSIAVFLRRRKKLSK